MDAWQIMCLSVKMLDTENPHFRWQIIVQNVTMHQKHSILNRFYNATYLRLWVDPGLLNCLKTFVC